MTHIRSYQGATPTLAEGVFIDDSAVVSGQVTLGKDASVWPCVSIRGDLMPITIGARSNIQDCAALHTTHASEFNPTGFPLIIGEDVTVGHNATLHGCTLENETLIGMNAVVLDGAVVQQHVLVAAGAVVGPGKILQSGYLYVGNPVRQARPLTDKEKRFFKYSAEHYIQLKNKHMGKS